MAQPLAEPTPAIINELMRAPDGPAVPVQRTEDIKEARLAYRLGAQLFTLVKDFPMSPTVRGQVLAKVKRWPFPEISEEDWGREPRDVWGWLMANLDLSAGTASVPNSPARPPSTRENTLIIRGVMIDETESGRVSYSVPVTYSADVVITEERMRRILRESDNRHDALRALQEYAVNDVRSNAEGDYGDYSYDDRDPSDSETESEEYGDCARVLDAYLEEHPELDPEHEEPEEEPEEEEDNETEEEPDEEEEAEAPF